MMDIITDNGRRHWGLPLIFLDIDGVLNHAAMRRVSGVPLTADPLCVSRLNQLTRQFSAMVVLTSSWRLCPSPNCDYAKGILRGMGIRAHLAGVTPDFQGGHRGDEIQAWLEPGLRGRPPFMILDDDDPVTLTQFWIATDCRAGGFNAASLKRAIRLLSEQGCRADDTVGLIRRDAGERW